MKLKIGSNFGIILVIVISSLIFLYWNSQTEVINPLKTDININVDSGDGRNYIVKGYFEPIDSERIGVGREIRFYIERVIFIINKNWYVDKLKEYNIEDKKTYILNLCPNPIKITGNEESKSFSNGFCMEVPMERRLEDNGKHILWENILPKEQIIEFSSEGNKTMLIYGNDALSFAEAVPSVVFVMERQISITKYNESKKIEKFIYILIPATAIIGLSIKLRQKRED